MLVIVTDVLVLGYDTRIKRNRPLSVLYYLGRRATDRLTCFVTYPIDHTVKLHNTSCSPDFVAA